MNFADISKKIGNIRVLVIGDLMIDHYMWGTVERISPEAPVPVVDVKKEDITLGGAGNVIKNIAALGAYSEIVSVIGDDAVGLELIELLDKEGVSTNGIFKDQFRHTTKKTRVLAAGHQMIRIDRETNTSISIELANKILAYVQIRIHQFNIVLISDYSKGVLTDELLKSIIALCRKSNTCVIVDPKGSDFIKYKGANIIKPNRKEAATASGMTISNNEDLKKVAAHLKEQLQSELIIITLSEEGMAINGETFEIIPTKATEVFDVTGAGDTVLASLGAGIAMGLSTKDACIFANHAAALVVSKIGSATTSIKEILRHIAQN